MNKREERFYVERAAEMLNVSWTVGEDREIPDFSLPKEIGSSALRFRNCSLVAWEGRARIERQTNQSIKGRLTAIARCMWRRTTSPCSFEYWGP